MEVKVKFGMHNDNTPTAESEILLAIKEAIGDGLEIATEVVGETPIDNSEKETDWFNDYYIEIEAAISVAKERVAETKEKLKDAFGFEEFLEDNKQFKVIYGRYMDIITTNCEQEAVDILVDKLEENGCTGVVIPVDEAEKDYNEDEYVIAGNHCLALLHEGNFMISEF